MRSVLALPRPWGTVDRNGDQGLAFYNKARQIRIGNRAKLQALTIASCRLKQTQAGPDIHECPHPGREARVDVQEPRSVHHFKPASIRNSAKGSTILNVNGAGQIDCCVARRLEFDIGAVVELDCSQSRHGGLVLDG
jgi:hypothetical protein